MDIIEYLIVEIQFLKKSINVKFNIKDNNKYEVK